MDYKTKLFQKSLKFLDFQEFPVPGIFRCSGNLGIQGKKSLYRKFSNCGECFAPICAYVSRRHMHSGLSSRNQEFSEISNFLDFVKQLRFVIHYYILRSLNPNLDSKFSFGFHILSKNQFQKNACHCRATSEFPLKTALPPREIWS